MPGIAFDSPLPPNASDHVAAIAAFGNPSVKLGLPLTASQAADLIAARL